MLWFALAVMTGLAVLAALCPLAFRRSPGFDAASEAAFYKAQLEEIERDVDRGQLPEPEAKSARAEAARRLIAASANQTAAPAGESAPRRRAAASFIFVVVPLVALGAYSWAGRPDLPDAPLASRATDAASPEAMEAMIANVEGRLTASPDDAKGWTALATVYMHIGRYDDAAAAFRQLLRLKGENGELRADYGEALVAAGGNVVTADARAAFERALADTPGLPKPRFYLALAAEQDGDTTRATELYQSLISDAKGDEPWKSAVAARLAALTGGPAPGAAPPAQASAGTEGMSAEQQQMVRGMVERLATRLGQRGGGAEEWARLIRAYSVLHETDKARQTLAAAQTALRGDAAAVANLDTLARDLGLAEKTQ